MKNFFSIRIWQNAGIALMAMLLVFASFNSVARADDGAVDSRKIITVYDRGEMKVIGAQAHTIGDALRDAGIVVYQDDSVEPGLDTIIDSESYTVNIYRARPVMVVEGQQRMRINTAAQDPATIARSAGVTLHTEDKTSIVRSEDVLRDGVGLELTITRAKSVQLSLYGKRVTLYTQSATVADLLKEKNIVIQKDDTLSIAPTTPITDGMSFDLWRNGVQTVSVEEPIAFETKETQDPNQTVGYKKVTKPGVDGIKNVTYEITMKNGQEVARKVIQETQTKDPVVEEVIVGSKPKVLAGNVSGQKAELMAAAGIASSDFNYVDHIIAKESGWNAGASNSSSGAYGLCQALPGSKMGSAGSDWQSNAVTQLRWCNSYAVSRYGSWAGAYSAWLRQHWW